ncbi:MAG: hypothetical protein A3K61_05375 [Thaumarchaeota archaeon RBG_16_49_8]|nr:hypothetical protein [Nitrososphaerota archaeon]OHE55541.1 MAG: hypothetical protein A3K61_05375 [Thaumarchaeota archaeon RBG_16_49_8]
MSNEEAERIEKILTDLGICTFQGRKVVLSEELLSVALSTNAESRYNVAMEIVAKRVEEKSYTGLSGDNELDKVAHYLATIFWFMEKKQEEGRSLQHA